MVAGHFRLMSGWGGEQRGILRGMGALRRCAEVLALMTDAGEVQAAERSRS